MADTGKVKMLQTQLKKYSEKLAVLDSERREANREYSTVELKVNNLLKELQKLTEDKLTVSEHAMLRYCEILLGIDRNHIKQKILKDETIEQIKTLGGGKIPICDDKLIAIVKGNVVVTVIQNNKE